MTSGIKDRRPALTQADLVEIRRLYGNERLTFMEIGKLFDRNASTIWRVVHTLDPVGATAPGRGRRRGAMERNNIARDIVPTAEPLVVVREPPRTEALQRSTEDQARAIMGELSVLLRGQQERLATVVDAETAYKTELEQKRLPRKDAYAAALALNKHYNHAVEGLRETLVQMGRLMRNYGGITIDQRQQTVVVEKEDFWVRVKRYEAYLDELEREDGDV